MQEACAHKGQNSDRTHSHAITYGDMEVIRQMCAHEAEKARIAGDVGALGEWLCWQALAATAFTLWTR